MKKVKFSLVVLALVMGIAGAFAGNRKSLVLNECPTSRLLLSAHCPVPNSFDCCIFTNATTLTDTQEQFAAGTIIKGTWQ